MSDAEEFEASLRKLKAPKEVKDKLQKEINRFKSSMNSPAESGVIRTYIETLLEMPWDKASKDNEDISYAEQVLEEDHYGLEQVKERILEFLAVRTLTKKAKARSSVLWDRRERERRPSRSLWQRRLRSLMCASPWAACGMRRRSAGTGRLMWEPCRDASPTVSARQG